MRFSPLPHCFNSCLTSSPGVRPRYSCAGREDVHHVWTQRECVPQGDVLFWPCGQSLDRLCWWAGGAGVAWYGCCRRTHLRDWWEQRWVSIPPRCAEGMMSQVFSAINANFSFIVDMLNVIFQEYIFNIIILSLCGNHELFFSSPASSYYLTAPCTRTSVRFLSKTPVFYIHTPLSRMKTS